jgi:hypothetical protein
MKQVILLALTCFTLSGAFAQTFTNGVGISVFSTQSQGSSSQISGAITYSPRINFVESESYSLSVGIPVSVGAQGSYNSQDVGNNSLTFLLNLPLVINFNMGAGSTRDNQNKFGFFVGGGFGYHYGTLNETTFDSYGNEYTDQSSVSSYGPVADGGVRIGLGHGHHNLEIRALYMKGIDASKADIFGGGVLFNF